MVPPANNMSTTRPHASAMKSGETVRRSGETTRKLNKEKNPSKGVAVNETTGKFPDLTDDLLSPRGPLSCNAVIMPQQITDINEVETDFEHGEDWGRTWEKCVRDYFAEKKRIEASEVNERCLDRQTVVRDPFIYAPDV